MHPCDRERLSVPYLPLTIFGKVQKGSPSARQQAAMSRLQLRNSPFGTEFMTIKFDEICPHELIMQPDGSVCSDRVPLPELQSSGQSCEQAAVNVNWSKRSTILPYLC